MLLSFTKIRGLGLKAFVFVANHGQNFCLLSSIGYGFFCETGVTSYTIFLEEAHKADESRLPNRV